MRRAAAVILALAGLISSSAPAAAASPPAVVITADLEGQPIAVAQIPSYYCHDRDFPRIHCFRTAPVLELARAALQPQGTAGLASPAPAAAADYATIYALPGHAGSYTVLSQNYDALAVIGWNDRIQSFTGLNSASGAFYTDWFAGGYRLTFCCNAYVSSLSSTFNNAVSSAYRT